MNRQVRRSLMTLLAVCFVSLVLITGCRKDPPTREDDSTTSAPSKPLTRVVLAQNPVPHSALPIIAMKKGFFAEEGLDVDVKEFTTGKLCFDAMLGGGADFATVAETPIMYAGFSKQPVYVIATIVSSPYSVKVIARKDKGVSSPADLKGKPMGTFKGGSAEYFLARFLEKHGMSLRDEKVTYMAPPELVAAIVRGDLAAIAMWEPHIYAAKKAIGGAAIVFTGEDLYTETFHISISKEYANQHPDRITAFLKGLAKAESFLKQHPDDAKALVQDHLSIDKDTLDNIWPNFRFGLALDANILEQLIREATFAIETGAIASGSQIPDYRSMFAPQFLRAIDARKVVFGEAEQP